MALAPGQAHVILIIGENDQSFLGPLSGDNLVDARLCKYYHFGRLSPLTFSSTDSSKEKLLCKVSPDRGAFVFSILFGGFGLRQGARSK
jgi:hypothetical protein